MALLTTLDPFRNLTALNDWVDEELSNVSPSRYREGSNLWHPAVDILENTNEYVINVELPGIDEKAIDMKIEKNTLTLKGERIMDEKENKENYSRMERHYGRFSRTFRLPDTVKSENVNAKLRKGVLAITLPKKEETKPRNIQVEVQ